MIQAKKAHMKFRSKGIGPGGWKCPCCAPAPGAARSLWIRTRKKQEREFYRKLIALELL